MRLKYRILDIEFLKVGLLGLIHEVAVPWIPSRRKDALGDKNTHDLFPNSQLSRHTFLEHKVVDKIYVAIREIFASLETRLGKPNTLRISVLRFETVRTCNRGRIFKITVHCFPLCIPSSFPVDPT